MMLFLDGGELKKEDVLKGLAEGIRTCSIYPVFVASAIQNLGVAQLMDALVDYMPAADKAPVSYTHLDVYKRQRYRIR